MFRKKEDGVSAHGVQAYATQPDFCRIFTEDKTGLYLLSLLLTADAEKAEQCFVAGLDDSINGNPVFREWARSWSKRVIIKNAIRMISPTMGQLNQPHASSLEALGASFGDLLAAVVQLAPFERFVFVMSVLEGYSIQETSIFLNCTKQEVDGARARALRSLAATRPMVSVLPGTGDFRAPHFLQPAQVA
jgi:hypothetical protein